MSFRIGPLPALLAVVLTAACGSTRTIEVHTVLDSGTGIRILKDPEHHDSAVVHPGDRVKFICRDCPTGTEFTVEKLRYVGDLDDIADALGRAGLADPDRVGSLIAGIEASGAGSALRGEGVAPADEKRLAEAVDMLRDLRVAFSAPREPAVEGGEHGPPRLFAEWTPPACCVPGREAIVTDRVGPLKGVGVWKFTWRVRLPGAGEDTWDPHIFGHPDDQWP